MMRLVRLSAVDAVVLAMVAWIPLQFLVGCTDVRSQSQDNMKQQAEIAISDAGGADILGREAKVILSNYQPGLDWMTLSDEGANAPAIMRVQSLLAPLERNPWVVKARGDIPAHVVIRFGSHRHYEYVWIFDPAHVPTGKIERVEHLNGAVYLSKVNK